MWEYKHTDEMYTGRFDRSEKLFHSDVYLGQEFSDGIYHWKYIKRERKNGRWVYYYNDEDMNKAQADARSAKKDYDNATTSMANLQKQNSKLNNKLRSNNSKITQYNNSGVFGKISKKKGAQSAVKDNEKIKKQQDGLQSKYSDSYLKQMNAKNRQSSAEYEMSQLNKKDRVRKAVAKGVAKGLDKASNAQHKLAKKIEKGKKAIANLFKKKKKK